jgi:error-prone DNA polymerase
MLPRLRPRCFYDLVIEVAIVRPGPIQGDMVHPYIRRRNGDEAVELPSEELRQVLGKTLGVPLFQEQAMRIAIIAAGFTPSESDQLRRAMATFCKTDKIEALGVKMIEGMVNRGYDRKFSERCFKQIEGFGNYGFPESHAASFALLVYVSSWMKCHMPAAFAAALLNSQPMGFYAPAQIVRDARDHGVNVLHPDVNYIGWDCDLEWQSDGKAALRLGLRQIKGLRRQDAVQIEKNKRDGYTHPRELISRAGVRSSTLELLARGDAFQSMKLSRRQAFWIVRGIANSTFDSLATKDHGLPLFSNAKEYHRNKISNIEPKVSLPIASIGEEVIDDYNVLRLSLKSHPLALLRENLLGDLYKPVSILGSLSDGSTVRLAGLVLVRQRPSTAKGVIFITIEDETGIANLIVWSRQFERFRHIIMNAKLLGVTGKLQREGEVMHIIVEALEDLTYKLNEISNSNFKESIAYADELKILDNSSEKSESNPVGEKKTLGVKSRDFH